MKDHSDSQLVDMAVRGRSEAFQQLFERHYVAVYRLSYKWSGSREDAEDIAQEVFVKIVRKLRTFRGKSSFKTWLYRIVLNTARDFGRKAANRRSLKDSIAARQSLHNPSGATAGRGDTAGLQAALGALPLKQREAVLLVLGEGMTHREAAGLLGCMEATVSWRIFQALKEMKKSLEQGI